MIMWTIYNKPKDFPNHYVLRPFIFKNGNPQPCGIARSALTLEGVRQYLLKGLKRLEGHPNDDFNIVEVWV